MDGVQFHPEDHDYFWRVMRYYAASQKMDTDLDCVELTPEHVVEMAQIAFPSLKITQPQALPGIPGYVLADEETPPVELLDNGNYRFVRSAISYSMETEQISVEDGMYQFKVTLINEAGAPEGCWDATIDALGAIRSMKKL